MALTITVATEGQHLSGPAYEMYDLFSKAYHQHRKDRPTKPFEVGKSYQRHDGIVVTCTELQGECALFSDFWIDEHDGNPIRLGWRYNRDSDRGRCTGSRAENYRNVIPEYVE